MKLKNLFSIVFLTWSVVPLVVAQDRPMRQQGNQPGFNALQELNLTEQQSKDIEKLRDDLMKQAIAQQAKTSTARVEFRELLRADQPDKALIEKKMNEVALLESQERMARVNHWFAVNKLLNPEQQKAWKRNLLMRASGPHAGMVDRGMRHRPFRRGR